MGFLFLFCITRNTVSSPPLGVIRETFYGIFIDGKCTTKRSGHTVLCVFRALQTPLAITFSKKNSESFVFCVCQYAGSMPKLKGWGFSEALMTIRDHKPEIYFQLIF